MRPLNLEFIWIFTIKLRKINGQNWICMINQIPDICIGGDLIIGQLSSRKYSQLFHPQEKKHDDEPWKPWNFIAFARNEMKKQTSIPVISFCILSAKQKPKIESTTICNNWKKKNKANDLSIQFCVIRLAKFG